MDSQDNSNSSSLPLGLQPFKSRFLKTERSSVLLKEEQEAKSESASRPMRTVYNRSTFSPLAKLPENVEIKATNSTQNDELTKNIQAFINRTDHVANEWKALGTENKTKKRSGSVERGSFHDDHSASFRPSLNVRASSVAPNMNFGSKLSNQSLNIPTSSSGYGSLSQFGDFTRCWKSSVCDFENIFDISREVREITYIQVSLTYLKLKYFTLKIQLKYNQINYPTINIEFCWTTFFLFPFFKKLVQSYTVPQI